MNHSKHMMLKLTFLLLSGLIIYTECRRMIDPTKGFIELPFNTSYYHNHKPYNLPIEERYSFINGVHRLWVYSTDKPLSKNSPTLPRSELIINGYEYSSGIWQFEAYGYVPCGTTGVCIMQVFGADPPRASSSMLRVYNGSLYHYWDSVVVPHIYDKWFRLNVIHDPEGNYVKIYIDRVLKYEGPGHGGKSHYFKCGVYMQQDATHESSFYMESRWKDIKIFKKCD